ncbi:hypothetical protein I6A84_01165 [Frankia sp. CNm7]|uniref:Uncharacterized protein n=1 Tax=Frankia nepalensis TaxID=1836974 RepID=A0A937RMP9_9ACTN|nr:hypothetical protein [Frankia nepalensis]MBL7496133.1 hypothetical protein [Frankia nepalensis]MBL7508928.1 hypothetical protein [Frankia nepalensis]MBL7516768.1 hypothetical protein [Frankia nepalensis]MBL7628706.1 hypothetical protein [Frankia nepalensis]
MSAAPNSPGTVRILLVMIAVLVGVIVALVGGILQMADHASVVTAIQCGGCAFAATVMFLLTVFHFLAASGDGQG